MHRICRLKRQDAADGDWGCSASMLNSFCYFNEGFKPSELSSIPLVFFIKTNMEYEVTFIMLAIAALVVGIIATYTHTLEIITPVALTALVFVVWHLHHNTAQDLSNQKMEMHDQRKLIKALSADAKLARNKLKQHILHFDQTLQVTQVEHAILLETLRNQRDAARAESTTARRVSFFLFYFDFS
ncbi:hypothetical protein BJ741DRAFT_57127 [Chytriomyces cf. hyalinus JEL632]|nr:hypothetical protein BJ741DRAFT_57127 [Chytriomyces cf. hyalinus JEL632]